MLKVEEYQKHYEQSHDAEESGRVICIGLHQHHDWMALHQIADWCSENNINHGYDIFGAISVDDLDHYDMTLRPEKGDAIDAIRRYDDVIAVIALHLFGLDVKIYLNQPDALCYSRENHKLLDLCLRRKIALICWGYQPFPSAPVPRRKIGTAPMLTPTEIKGAEGVVYPIYLYERV